MSNFVRTSTNVSEDFDYWAAKNYVGEDLKQSVASSEILFIPCEGFRGYEEPLFPQGTDELYRFFKTHAPSIAIELAIDDDKYKQFALYADTKRISSFLVSNVVFPLFLGLLTNYVYDQLKVDGDNKIQCSVTIVDKSNKISRRLDYEGPPGQFLEILEKESMALSKAAPDQKLTDRTPKKRVKKNRHK